MALLDPGRFINKPVKADAGLNVKFGITPTVTLDFTVNPDFAQVEADQPVVITPTSGSPFSFPRSGRFFWKARTFFRLHFKPCTPARSSIRTMR